MTNLQEQEPQSLWAFKSQFCDSRYTLENFKGEFSAELLNAQDSIGYTLLHCAACYNRDDIYNYLIELGADTEIKTKSTIGKGLENGETAVEMKARLSESPSKNDPKNSR